MFSLTIWFVDSLFLFYSQRGRAAEAEVVFEKLLGGAYVKAAMAELMKSDRGDDADSAKLSELLFGRSFRGMCDL